MLSNIDKISSNKIIKDIFNILNDGEEETACLLVGGCIRNLVIEKEIDDYDIVTILLPEKIKEKLNKINLSFDDTFEKYGSIKILTKECSIEINTLRKDYNQDGRHTDVMFTNDWKQDALRRDFSMNAIYSDLEGRVYDPFNGIDDLKNGKIVFIGDPLKKIEEDGLRVLRYFRFFVQFSKHDHEEYVLNAITKNIEKIKLLSSERLIGELKKILLSGEAYKIFDNDFSKNFYLSVYKGIKYLNRLEFKKRKRILRKDIDWVILLSLLLIDQTKNFERFVKDFNISNEIKNRLGSLQKQFTFKTADTVDKIEVLLKRSASIGPSAVRDFIDFQYLVNEKYSYDLYLENISILNKTTPPKFEFDTQILISKGFKENKSLGDAISFLKHRWLSNNYKILDKDIEDAVKLFK